MPFWLKIFLSVLVVEILGGAGGIITAGSIADWYVDLDKPPGNPPNSIFGPVWTAIYALIGISFAVVWEFAEIGEAKRRAYCWFFIQLILNLSWTPVFFGLQQPLPALVIIIALIVAIVFTFRAFRPLVPASAWLLVPYLAWVCYATYLNAGLWWLNR
ncbi:MAG: tryptophan-rich sensory protein [Verrucomicrobiales bacterium]|nr:tryptophan-rich sensory protein [Verrucomicrobiales bacterium]